MIYCTECGCRSGAHFSSCPVIGRAIAQTRVDHEAMLEALEKSRAAPSTAYDRAQAEAAQRLRKQELLQIRDDARMDNMFRRIEALERDIALDRAEAIKSEKRIEALLDRVNQLVEFHGIAPIGGADVPGVWKANMLTVTKVDVENGRVELRASPATAYPPLPDEVCHHDGIGLPGCTTCDPRTGPRAGASRRPLSDEGT